MKRLLAEPLLHFVVLGAVLFGLFSLVGKKEVEEPAKIVISAGRIENLANGFALIWHRPPSADELRGLVDDYVQDEVFYREGKALGLDRDDIVVRRRLRQKLEFMAEDVTVAEPSDEQLAAYQAANSERFRSEDRVTFSQVYLSAARHATLDHDANLMAAKLAVEKPGTDAASLGDHFLLGGEFHSVTRNNVVGTFGQHFADAVFDMKPGRWTGPVSSGYGLHFVRVDEHTQGSLLPLDSVKPAVRREWMNARRVDAERTLYETLRARYQIVIEAPASERKAGDQLAGAVR